MLSDIFPPDASAQTSRLGARDREEVDYESLSISQQQSHDLVLRACSIGFGHSKTNGSLDVSRLIIIGGGSGDGKSRVTNSIMNSLQQTNDWNPTNMLITATSGKAATGIDGCTIFSYKDSVGIPLGKQIKLLGSVSLKIIQAKFLGKDDCNLKLKLLIIDEFSMLKARELCYVDKLLSQIMECNNPFGGITVVLVGDLAQLTPVQVNPV